MEIHLTESETTGFLNAEWKAGFLAALKKTLPKAVENVVIFDNNGVELAKYGLMWVQL